MRRDSGDGGDMNLVRCRRRAWPRVSLKLAHRLAAQVERLRVDNQRLRTTSASWPPG